MVFAFETTPLRRRIKSGIAAPLPLALGRGIPQQAVLVWLDPQVVKYFRIEFHVTGIMGIVIGHNKDGSTMTKAVLWPIK